jgi:Mg/Co/Ni transporter MgtE
MNQPGSNEASEMINGLNGAVDGISKFMLSVQQSVTPEVLSNMSPEQRKAYDKAMADYNKQMGAIGSLTDQMKNALTQTKGL